MNISFTSFHPPLQAASTSRTIFWKLCEDAGANQTLIRRLWFFFLRYRSDHRKLKKIKLRNSHMLLTFGLSISLNLGLSQTPIVLATRWLLNHGWSGFSGTGWIGFGPRVVKIFVLESGPECEVISGMLRFEWEFEHSKSLLLSPRLWCCMVWQGSRNVPLTFIDDRSNQSFEFCKVHTADAHTLVNKKQNVAFVLWDLSSIKF